MFTTRQPIGIQHDRPRHLRVVRLDRTAETRQNHLVPRLWGYGGLAMTSARFPCTAQELEDEPIMDAAQQANEPGWKLDGGKPRMDLIAPEMIEQTAAVLTYGAVKYEARNWEKGMSWGRVFGALMRHLWAWWRGEKTDPETGLSHLAHASCCLMFLMAYEARGVGKDDRKVPA